MIQNNTDYLSDDDFQDEEIVQISKHKLLLDKVEYSSKPKDNEIGIITNRIIKCPVEITIQELAKAAASGQTWVSSLCKIKRNDASFISSSVLALDFDSGITLDKVLERLKQHGLDCTFAYSTFSSKPELPKFRVVFQLGKVIDKLAERRNIQLAVMALFHEVDPAPKAPSNLFFGGKSIIYPNYEYFLDLENDFIQTQLLEQQKKIRKRISGAIEKVASEVKNNKGISKALQNHDKEWEKNDGLYNKYIDSIGNLPLSDTTQTQKQVDIDALTKKIHILDDLVKGKWLTYPDYFGLVTNLVPIKGGVKLYKESLDKMVEINQDKIEFKQALLEKPNFLNKLYFLPSVINYYVRNYDYHPTNLKNFSPYKNDWYYINLMIASQKKRPVRIHEYETISIREARQELKRIFDYVIQSTDNKVHVLKVATGLGKSELCTNLTNVVLAFPNHLLKAEMSERMKINHEITPNQEELPTEIKKHLTYFYSIGAYSQAVKYLVEHSENNQQVKEYLEQIHDCYKYTETVLTTHQKSLFVPWKNHNTIIFDEDITTSLLPTGFIKIDELNELESKIKNAKDKKNLAEFIKNINNGKANTPKILDLRFEDFRSIENELLNNKIYTSNILQFLKSKIYVTDSQDKNTIHFISRLELPKDKKIIILSATANENIYRTLLGERLEFYDVSNVEPDGLIIQDTIYSLSRNSLKEENPLKYIVDILKPNQVPTITFRGFRDRLKALGVNVVEDIYFGKTTGFDKLKGQDIAVVGTPHVNSITIKLYCKLLNVGLALEEGDYKTRQQEVEHNGFRFLFKAYDNEYLRNLQFFFIESELMQAIGRARVNTKPCTVTVYSNYPLPEACINENEKVLGEERSIKKILKTSSLFEDDYREIEAYNQPNSGEIEEEERFSRDIEDYHDTFFY
ncbi:hypothetical protein Syn7502_01388 [Synechococcus sp. PCC 7502]|uniref:hypothetical protein n=1 Tax=Synechococcus sp. PCC 7502 TaxID=1173263 RepID=UPI00029F9AFB|nr:hypothetical protein [Synechococcus sp. PCC 7502]AFY73473.1 hypothetical protein Syn7502_01388 [Synechococcus sp. PCC 7502]